MDTLASRFRLRLLPALLTAAGVILLGNGLLSYTSAVEEPPPPVALATFEPLPTIDTTVVLPPPGETAEPTFPPDRVVTRVVVRRLGIDLPIMLQDDDKYGAFPLCDVALYLPFMGQPGQGRATYIYAHARTGMFLPLLRESRRNAGQRMIGWTVEVYTSDNWRFLYKIVEVRRHTKSLDAAAAADWESVWLQTSEGPLESSTKLQVVADFDSAEPADPTEAHPKAKPRVCV
ncbi:MAG: hypothetical protein FIA92_00325 [Chloroflexi bacterium]|nr:hypothetical protein [Chloroflexota bacterium]